MAGEFDTWVARGAVLNVLGLTGRTRDVGSLRLFGKTRGRRRIADEEEKHWKRPPVKPIEWVCV
ncbi:hypothetical protein ColTof4_13225 [Colletotrichum tofieldiae]|nr:hypothetical protein ColTof3_00136 [Colletotrichum tofieldiae]GKT80802.1 hypothetical protein ColTof4_13225 [Colletotrichum tofieldiae]GKT88933.1 hypothetical protein Ct61P_06783 [Colletotrichum tofieldiae]